MAVRVNLYVPAGSSVVKNKGPLQIQIWYEEQVI